MQAQGMRRFTFTQLSGTTLALVVLASTLIGVGVLRETNSLPFGGETTSSVSAPPAVYNPPSDRGLSADLNAGADTTTAYTSPTMGEGLLDMELRAIIAGEAGAAQGTFPDEGIAPPLVSIKPVLQAHTSLGQGEGIIGGFNVYTPAAPIDADRMIFLDSNLYLPTGTLPEVQPAVQDATDMKFWDDNLYLPDGGDTSQRLRPGQGLTAH